MQQKTHSRADHSPTPGAIVDGVAAYHLA
eukprot:COSAG02_NODE_26573_length_630_cov_0.777778_2_plen_28_part_01